MMTTLNFKSLWQLDIPWFEEPNKTRGGWSGVLQHTLPDVGPVFIKKQENYIKKTWFTPIRGMLTVRYEKKNIDYLTRINIPTLDVLYFEENYSHGKRQGVLVTRALEGYEPLDVFLEDASNCQYLSDISKVLEEMLVSLHQKKRAHCALYPKHLFVKVEGGKVQLKIIDLEKMRWKPLRILCLLHDLNKLNRHLQYVSVKRRLRFLQSYLERMNLMWAYSQIKNFLFRKSLKP